MCVPGSSVLVLGTKNKNSVVVVSLLCRGCSIFHVEAMNLVDSVDGGFRVNHDVTRVMLTHFSQGKSQHSFRN